MTADAQSIVCVKKGVKLPGSGKTLKLSSYFSASTGECPTGYSEIFTQKSPANSLTELKEIDGAGSGLDADFLDGKTSSEFATSTDLSALSTTVSSTQSSLATVEASVTSAQGSISTLQGSVSTLQGSLTSTQTSVTTAQSNITTLQTNVTNLASETRLARVIRVATSGGDYTSLATAVASIASPSTSNPYIIHLAPGTHTLASALVIPSGVLIEGSGAGITTITGAVGAENPSDAALLKFSEGAKLKNVSVINTYSDVLAFSTAIAFTDLTSTPSSDQGGYGTEIDGVRIVIPSPDGKGGYGIYIRGSDVRIKRTTITGIDTSAIFVGLYLDGFGSACSAYVEDANIFVSGLVAYGILINGSSSIIHLLGSHVTSNDSGVEIASGGDIHIFNSSINATNTGLRVSGALGSAVINSSELKGSPRTSTAGGAALTCTNVTSPDGGAASCP